MYETQPSPQNPNNIGLRVDPKKAFQLFKNKINFKCQKATFDASHMDKILRTDFCKTKSGYRTVGRSTNPHVSVCYPILYETQIIDKITYYSLSNYRNTKILLMELGDFTSKRLARSILKRQIDHQRHFLLQHVTG